MNKYVAMLSVMLGIGVAVMLVTIANPTPRLRLTEDSKLRADYDAPIASFMGTMPKGKGAAHTPRTKRTSAARNCASLSADEPTFGQFSTAQAMGYHAESSYNSKVPNPQAVVGDPRHAH